jgi:hypothetical protein
VGLVQRGAWVESTDDKSSIAVANSAVLRYDLFRDIFVLGPNNSVSRAEIDERFDVQEAIKGLIDGKYTIKLRGPGMMGPYLEDAEGGGSMPDIVGLKNGLEYWVSAQQPGSWHLVCAQPLVLKLRSFSILPLVRREKWPKEHFLSKFELASYPYA